MKMLSALLLTLLCLGCGYSSPKAAPAQPGVVPAIMALLPDNKPAGTAFILTVNGSSFAANARVNFNSTQQATTYVTANQLTAMIPASAMATAATVPVTVTNPATPGMGGIYGGSGVTAAETSAPMNFRSTNTGGIQSNQVAEAGLLNLPWRVFLELGGFRRHENCPISSDLCG